MGLGDAEQSNVLHLIPRPQTILLKECSSGGGAKGFIEVGAGPGVSRQYGEPRYIAENIFFKLTLKCASWRTC